MDASLYRMANKQFKTNLHVVFAGNNSDQNWQSELQPFFFFFVSACPFVVLAQSMVLFDRIVH